MRGRKKALKSWDQHSTKKYCKCVEVHHVQCENSKQFPRQHAGEHLIPGGVPTMEGWCRNHKFPATSLLCRTTTFGQMCWNQTNSGIRDAVSYRQHSQRVPVRTSGKDPLGEVQAIYLPREWYRPPWSNLWRQVTFRKRWNLVGNIIGDIEWQQNLNKLDFCYVKSQNGVLNLQPLYLQNGLEFPHAVFTNRYGIPSTFFLMS